MAGPHEPTLATSKSAIDLSPEALGGKVRIDGRSFLDGSGRVLLLHGMNASGASKLCVASCLCLWPLV